MRLKRFPDCIMSDEHMGGSGQDAMYGKSPGGLYITEILSHLIDETGSIRQRTCSR